MKPEWRARACYIGAAIICLTYIFIVPGMSLIELCAGAGLGAAAMWALNDWEMSAARAAARSRSGPEASRAAAPVPRKAFKPVRRRIEEAADEPADPQNLPPEPEYDVPPAQWRPAIRPAQRPAAARPAIDPADEEAAFDRYAPRQPSRRPFAPDDQWQDSPEDQPHLPRPHVPERVEWRTDPSREAPLRRAPAAAAPPVERSRPAPRQQAREETPFEEISWRDIPTSRPRLDEPAPAPLREPYRSPPATREANAPNPYPARDEDPRQRPEPRYGQPPRTSEPRPAAAEPPPFRLIEGAGEEPAIRPRPLPDRPPADRSLRRPLR